MIDPHRTGAGIARLRRARDWAQIELVDRLVRARTSASCQRLSCRLWRRS